MASDCQRSKQGLEQVQILTMERLHSIDLNE